MNYIADMNGSIGIVYYDCRLVSHDTDFQRVRESSVYLDVLIEREMGHGSVLRVSHSVRRSLSRMYIYRL